MRPEEGQAQSVVSALVSQGLEASIAIDLQDAAEAAKVSGRMLALAVGAEAVGGSRRSQPLPGPSTSNVAREPGMN